MVDRAGLEPAASRVRGGRSATDLPALVNGRSQLFDLSFCKGKKNKSVRGLSLEIKGS